MTAQEAYVHFETEFGQDALGRALLQPMRGIVTGEGGIEGREFDAWVDDVHERAADGEYFFSLNQYLFLAEKPVDET